MRSADWEAVCPPCRENKIKKSSPTGSLKKISVFTFQKGFVYLKGNAFQFKHAAQMSTKFSSGFESVTSGHLTSFIPVNCLQYI